MKSLVMRGQLAVDSQKIKRILSKIPSDFKPSGIRVPLPATATPEQFKPFPGQLEGLSLLPLLPYTSTSRHSLPATKRSTLQFKENEESFKRHKRSHSSDVVDSLPLRSANTSESLMGATGIDTAAGRRHTYSAAMMQRKQSVLAAADVLVVPLKMDCFTGQNATSLQLKHEQQVRTGRVELWLS